MLQNKQQKILRQLTAEDVITVLDLKPHPKEGGYFRETYRAAKHHDKNHRISTAIYYLLTPDTFSCLHKLGSDEIFHFYMGDPVEMLWLNPDGIGRTIILGTDLAADQQPQVIVPAGIWQGSRLKEGTQQQDFALLGCTVAPGFEYSDYETADRNDLITKYSQYKDLIDKLTFPQ